MLKGGAVIPSASVSGKNREKIVSSLDYLFRLGRTERSAGCRATSMRTATGCFCAFFGFSRYDNPDIDYKYTRVTYPMNELIDVSRYDVSAFFEISTPLSDGRAFEFQTPSGAATLRLRQSDGGAVIELLGGAGQPLASFDVSAVFERFETYSEYGVITLEEASFTSEGGGGRLLVVAETVERHAAAGSDIRYARLHVYAGLS